MYIQIYVCIFEHQYVKIKTGNTISLFRKRHNLSKLEVFETGALWKTSKLKG